MEHDLHDRRVLHALSQRPGKTGSGITLDALVRGAARAGWAQSAIVGVPASDTSPAIAELSARSIHPVRFEHPPLPFPVPGMSDVMPYPSTVFRTMDQASIDQYARSFENAIGEVVATFSPSLIHSHHVWIMSSIIKDVAPDVPVITHCHATGLRQMQLCHRLAQRVVDGCRRNDLFAALSEQHAALLAETLDIDSQRVRVVGAGYREDLFHTAKRRPASPTKRILYVGKYSKAKGVIPLLDAFEAVHDTHHPIELHVAGSGAGIEASMIEARMRDTEAVVLHGMLDQPALADLMRTCEVCVLPSFYEGVPLVLVEALACGCRIVATKLPGVTDQIAPHAHPFMHLIDLPPMRGIDVPDPSGLPSFVDSLVEAMATALDAPPATTNPTTLEVAVAPFGWRAVFGKVARMWNEVAREREGARA